MPLIYHYSARWLCLFLGIAVLTACRGTITTIDEPFSAIPAGQQISLQGFSGFAKSYQLFSLQQTPDGTQPRLYFAEEPRNSYYDETYATIESITSAGTAPAQYHFSGICQHAFTMTDDGAHFLCTDEHRLLLTGVDGNEQQLALNEGLVKSVAVTPDGLHLALLAHEDAGDYLTIADLTLAPLSLHPRLRLALPVIAAEDVYPAVIGYPYYGLTDANPAPFYPADRLYAFALS